MTVDESRRITKGERRLFIAVALFILAVTGLSWWWITIDTNPVVNIPPYPAMPVPNAFDSYVAAGSAVNTSCIVATVIATPPSAPAGTPAPAAPAPLPGVPAPGALRPAQPPPPAAPVSASVGEAVDNATNYGNFALADKEALVAANTTAITTLRAGFGDDYREPNGRSINALFPWYGRYREMERFLAFAAHVRADEGDYTGSLALALDGMQLGQADQHDTILIGDLVGMACQAITRNAAWDVLPHLSGKDARAGAQRLEAILAQQPADFASVLTEEKYFGQSGIMEICRTPRTQWETFAESSIDLPMFTCNKREAMTEYTAYMDACITRARLPRRKRGVLPPEPKNNILLTIMLPVTDRAEFKADICLCENRLLLAALGVRAYQAEHGVPPDTLADLVPGYLSAVPDDPFGSGPLLYKRTGDTYVLYSVGPNGADDGGTPCPGKTVEANSGGDIVAGVNRN